MNATFADRLCYIMEKRGISAKDLAQRTNTPLAVISQYKSGKYKPKQNRLYDFATVLDVSIPWLMGLDVPMTAEKEKAPTEADAEINEYLDELKNRREMRMLFSVTKDATKEEIEQAVKIIMALRTKDE